MKLHKPLEFIVLRMIAMRSSLIICNPIIALSFVLPIFFAVNGLTAEETGRGKQIKPEQISFERHIYPILKTHCISCHGE
ncbi:MAG: hypothetical protein ACKO0V_06880, partial [bacterium]